MENNNPYYNRKIQKILNKIISEEWMAGQMYRLFLNTMTGDCRGMCMEKFMEISDDETNDHMQSLIDWAIDFGYSVPSRVSEFEKYADPKQVKLYSTFKKNEKCDYYLDRAIASEEGAIASYEEALQTEELQEFGDLNGILLKNYYEEIQHLEELGVMLYTFNISVNMEE